MPRQKILREPLGFGYPLWVCKRCGTYAAEDSKTQLEESIDTRLEYCGVCKQFDQVASPQEYGCPTFYTYANGAPVRG